MAWPDGYGAQVTDVDDDARADLLAGRFELTTILGRGGMSTVWAANDTRLGRVVAVKILHAHLSAEDAQRVEREARAAARIGDPRVVTILDLDHDENGMPFLVFEALSGRTLADEIRESGALAPERAQRLSDDLLGALAAAHECGVLHRDIKPSNVLVDGDGFRITDFGIASVDDETATRGDLIGTLGYLAPERFDGAAATPQSDVFSAAAVLYEAVTGRQPFRAATAALTIERLRRGDYDALPDETEALLRAVIVTGLDPDPSRRSPGARALTERIDSTLASTLGSPTPDVSPTQRLDRTEHLPPQAPIGSAPNEGPHLRERLDLLRRSPRVVDTTTWMKQPQTLFIGLGALLLILLFIAASTAGGDGVGPAGDVTNDPDPASALDENLQRIEDLG